MGDIFRVSGFLPIQRLVVCPIPAEEVGLTSNDEKKLSSLCGGSHSYCVTFEFEFALQLLVDVILVKLGISRLKVKVFLKLHGTVAAAVDSSPAAVASSSAAAVGLSCC